MQNAQPPEQVQAAFDDAVKAGQDRERQKNEGQAYANDVIPKARGAAARLVQEAEGYRQRVIEQAEGDAAYFRQLLAEYSKAPQVTRERLYIEAMQQILSNTSKVLIDQKSGNNLLYLPLDRMMQLSGALAGKEQAAKPPETPSEPSTARSREAFREKLRAAVVKLMDAARLDALAYPTWSNPPRLIGDLNTPGGDNSQFFSPTTGFPSIQVPMGYTRGGRLPAGITFFGRAWSEPTLIKYAFAYEQATHHRRPPETTPPLR